MIGHVQEVVLENFKSYAGRVHVGPFRKFTCVVGPNGAGKSNLMDAVSFVLGVRPRHLRSERLKDLIYSREGESAEIAREASVELVYSGIAPGDGGGDVGEGELAEVKRVFRRVITAEAESRFQVDRQDVPEEEYMRQLKSINVLSQARNFVVFQGDVEAAAHRHGKDLTSFFEQVSGSAAFRVEYDRLAVLKAQREEAARVLYSRKRNAMNEKKRLEAQKKEVDKFNDIQAEFNDTHIQFYLFRFHCIQYQQEDLIRKGETVEEKQSNLRQTMANRQTELETAEANRAEAHAKVSECERSASAKRAQVEGANPESVSVRTQLDLAQLELRDLKANIDREARKQQDITQQITELKGKENKLKVDLQSITADLQKELFTTLEQREEFEEARRMADKHVSESSLRIRDAEAKIRTTAAERARVDSERRQAVNRKQQLRRRVVELTEACQDAQAAQEQAEALVRECGEKIRERQGDGEGQAKRKEQLRAKRQQLMQDIQNITATAQQIERERRLVQLTADLQQLEPGVQGRLSDLCKPPHKKMNVAVNVALGGNADAIVTETKAGAHRCLRHLKERMLGCMTFLPQDDLRGPAPDRRLEEAVRGEATVRMALDCCNFKEKYRRACEFVLGNTVIADNLVEGRRFVFETLRARGLTCKLVTLDGEVISAAGNMSVSSDAAKAGATIYDFKEVERSRVQLEAIERELNRIRSNHSNSDQVALQEEAKRLEARERENELTLMRYQDELSARQKDLREVDATIEELSPQSQRLAEQEARERREQAALDESIGQSVSSYFKHLSEAMHVEDIRREERKWREEREDTQRREREISQEIGAVNAELAMLDQGLRELTRDPREVERVEAEIAELTTRQTKVGHDKRGLEGELSKLETTLRKLMDEERNQEQIVAGARRKVRDTQQEVAEIDRKIAAINEELSTLAEARTDLLRRRDLDGVDIPLIQGGREALQDVAPVLQWSLLWPDELDRLCVENAIIKARATFSGGNQVQLTVIRGHAELEIVPNEKDFPIQVSKVSDGEPDLLPDLSALAEEKQAVTSGLAAKMIEEEYRAELRRLTGEMERLRPNMKVIEQLAAAAEEADDAMREALEARKNIEDTQEKFEAARKARRERFMECFQKVSAEISTIYKKLTACSMGPGHEGGGAAYLDLEDLEDPFNGGIKFTAMPPAKRFCDITLLSGGEKTLAALALIFAMQAYQHPPFLILDEVDAYLDTGNLTAMASYVEQAACQIIVISLKDKFFSRSESLVGVSRNKESESSMILTMDLARLRRSQAPAPLADVPLMAASRPSPQVPLSEAEGPTDS